MSRLANGGRGSPQNPRGRVIADAGTACGAGALSQVRCSQAKEREGRSSRRQFWRQWCRTATRHTARAAQAQEAEGQGQGRSRKGLPFRRGPGWSAAVLQLQSRQRAVRGSPVRKHSPEQASALMCWLPFGETHCEEAPSALLTNRP